MPRYHGYGYGYGCGAEVLPVPIPPIGPAVVPAMSVSPVPSIAPLANHPLNITSPAIPGIAPGPGPAMTGVHPGIQYGMACVPIAFFPFDFEM